MFALVPQVHPSCAPSNKSIAQCVQSPCAGFPHSSSRSRSRPRWRGGVGGELGVQVDGRGRGTRSSNDPTRGSRGFVLLLSFVEPNKPNKPKKPDEPDPRHAPRNGSGPLVISLQLTTNLPRFPADECEKISRTVHDSKNESLVVLQEIDDTVPSEDQFSKVRRLNSGTIRPIWGVVSRVSADSTTRSTNVIAWRTESRAIKSSMS